MKKINYVKVTYMVEEWHEAIVGVDAKLDKSDQYQAVQYLLDDIKLSCPQDHLSGDFVNDDSVTIQPCSASELSRLNDYRYLISRNENKYFGVRINVTKDKVH